jgi:hypothetical protein
VDHAAYPAKHMQFVGRVNGFVIWVCGKRL